MHGDYKNADVTAVPQGVAMKKCPNCRADIDADSMYCEYCGSKIGSSNPTSANVSYDSSQGPKPKAPLGIGSLVFSIIGLASLFLMLIVIGEDASDMVYAVFAYIGIPASIVGMVLGIVGLKRIKGNYKAYSNAPTLIVGKILGIVGVATWGLVMLLGIIVILVEEGLEGFL